MSDVRVLGSAVVAMSEDDKYWLMSYLEGLEDVSEADSWYVELWQREGCTPTAEVFPAKAGTALCTEGFVLGHELEGAVRQLAEDGFPIQDYEI